MFDSYGNKQEYVLEPNVIDWGGEYNPHRTYKTTDGKLVQSGSRYQLDRENAERFAKFNDMKLITEAEYDILWNEMYPESQK